MLATTVTMKTSPALLFVFKLFSMFLYWGSRTLSFFALQKEMCMHIEYLKGFMKFRKTSAI